MKNIYEQKQEKTLVHFKTVEMGRHEAVFTLFLYGVEPDMLSLPKITEKIFSTPH